MKAGLSFLDRSLPRFQTMFGFLKQVGDYTRDAVDAARNLTQGLSVTFDHMKRRPITVQYPYEKLIPSERYRGRIHYEFDKCIACEVCVRVCPINLPVVDWVMNKETKKKNCATIRLISEFASFVVTAWSTAPRIVCR